MPIEEYDQERQMLGESRSRYNSRDELADANIDDSGNICSQCSRIDFERIFNSKVPKVGGYMVAKLGYRTSAWETTTCSLCRLFAAVRVTPSTVGFGGGVDYQLRAVSFLKSTPEAFPNTATKALAGFDNVCLIVLPDTRQPMSQEMLTEALTQSGARGVICRIEMSSSDNPSTFGVRRVQPNAVDYHLLRAWINICLQHHYSSFSLENSRPLASLRLIDCKTRLVVKATSSLPYVALSYVWGSKSSQKSSHQPRNLRTGDCIPDILPNVIEDAITVTLKLDWQYLWVDRLCIDQEDDADKHGQIGQMDQIFSGASATLVAAAGLDADFGLPGVGETPRRPQPFAVIRGQRLVSTMRRPEMSILQSKWLTRGWTYQEAVLSTRRLVFTEEQISFECKCMSCCESVVDPLILPINQSQENAEFRSQMRKDYFGSYTGLGQKADQEESANVISQIRDHVKRFTARELSYESDSLHAFLGILNQYRNRSPPIHHFWGLPVNYPGIVQAPLAFVISLCWQHPLSLNREPPRRREGSPSFSWAGWSGVALLPRWSPWAVEMLTATDKKLQPSATRSFLLTQVTKELAGRPLPSYYLKLDVNMIQIQLQYIPASDPGTSDFWFVGKSKNEREEYHFPAILSKRPSVGDEYLERLRTRPCDCLIMAGPFSLLDDVTVNSGDVTRSFLWNFLLLVEQHGDTYERIGVISDRDLSFLTYKYTRTKRRIWLG